MIDIKVKLTGEFSLSKNQIENTIKLIDEGNTIPFIARYRKEMTGSLSDETLRDLHERLVYLRNLRDRKKAVERLIDEQGKLDDRIRKSLLKAETLKEVEDIYRPFRPKRKTKALIAKEKGLNPLARTIMLQEYNNSIEELAEKYLNPEKGVEAVDDALKGALNIIAEDISDNPLYRKYIRKLFIKEGVITTKAKKNEDSVYRMYYDFKEPLSKLATHRILAINRGEKEEFIKAVIEVPDSKALDYIKSKVLKNQLPTAVYIEKAIEDSYSRLIRPSIEKEVRNELTELAQNKSMKVFADNLKYLLLQPPVKGRVVLGLDPAYRTGCKLAVVDDTGKVLDTTVIYPTPPLNRVEEAKKVVKALIEKHNITVISIGNGTASKESEIFISKLLKEIDREVYYMVVSESGASVYSASKLAASEFPKFDVSLRSAVSIARRLQDSLAELVKIDPKAIGVGQYQHDMNQRKLGETLGGVVENCVNSVGVDLNTASPSLLSYVSGINSNVAQNIVGFRDANGRFYERKELKKVRKLGDKTFEQCAGFLRIPGGKSILDNTSVHPESYDAVLKLLNLTGYTLDDVKNKQIGDLKNKVHNKGISSVAEKTGIGVPTLSDIIEELLRPGRDPRDELPKPLLLTDVMDINDIKTGMVFQGTIRNVVDFGAFVDIGVHHDGLVHISQLCDRFVKNPMDVVSVGDIVKVKVLDVDVERERISLSMRDVE